MKSIFLTIVVLGYLFFSPQVLAQTPSVSSCSVVPTLAIPFAGVTCGNASDPCNNKCCINNKIVTKHPWDDVPIIGQVMNQVGFTSSTFSWTSLITEANLIQVDPCSNGIPSIPGDLSNPGCICIQPTRAPLNELKKMCANIRDGGEQGKCEACLGGVGQDVGMWTGMGCIRANIGSFIQETLLGWGVGLAGGISMLCIMYAAFMMQTSGGEAEKIKKAQQLMTSCITGLMLIIFSVFILQLIGVRILRIPGFN